jgi:hypothetical protein
MTNKCHRRGQMREDDRGDDPIEGGLGTVVSTWIIPSRVFWRSNDAMFLPSLGGTLRTAALCGPNAVTTLTQCSRHNWRIVPSVQPESLIDPRPDITVISAEAWFHTSDKWVQSGPLRPARPQRRSDRG